MLKFNYIRKFILRFVGVLMPIIGITGLASLFALWAPGGLLTEGPAIEDKTIIIKKGTGLLTIAEELATKHVINYPWLFVAGTFLSGNSSKVKAGEYLIPAGASPENILKILCSGKVVVHQITIPPGLTVQQVVDLLNKNPNLAGEIKEIPKEGTVLPDTYNFIHDDTREGLIKRMKAAMDQALQEIWGKRADNLPFNTPEEALILASIIEKETGKANERAKISGVFVNRLEKDMKLQSDPTAAYAVTEGKKSLKRRLTRKDLRFESPINTYHVEGLPPTPIACPGKKALEAAVRPQKTNHLFFVANGAGGHNFSTNYRDHSRHVETWRGLVGRNSGKSSTQWSQCKKNEEQ